ncbi:hypothetical protein M1M14_gp160 [Synechococcus phage ACG-2014e]|uniref:Uncharacterized protein n=1 Tax=Synechococcus phage ACG-2014e TaxID=1493510 RepID=A0A0E3HJY1_9CAUD|nr:hypothetical protein AAJ58_gp157 [Synechococcus phage ACG-2014e]YP_010355772.1 hypothetical protein M1M14_gp160 [Synechococcus phage ACG-2014e]AIX20623.1 hypothetical protein Syn7803C85_160 [Synechococcus phage ACG-2014e]AIX29838.1 hypothetical protein Syn7803US33_157 [Synechococcus phage ACG-2014e]AIX45076.1 hypothetical protein Syn7803C2_157 [Synechococcus phage ACG-2014e]
MSKKSESNLNEMMAGDGSGLQLPPAFVMVNPRQHRKYKKNNQDKVDGRTSGARTLFDRIQKRKMKEQVESQIDEAIVSDTERAQKSIQQGKKLNRQKDMQKKRKEAKEKMMNKSGEMDTLMKARMSDFKKKAKDQEKKVQKNSYEPTGEIMTENQDVVQVALDVATSELNPQGEGSFAKVQFGDGSTQNLDNFSAKRIAACYAQLDDTHKQQFQYLLNKDASSYQTALNFAVRNV